MARRGDARSPSPTGSYSSARHGRRDDDRRNKDKRRSRSPVDNRKYRDRDSHKSSKRSPDRRGNKREDDTARQARRDRSRDRNRSPDRGAVRERRRSRDRDDRRRRDDSRDRNRRGQDDSRDSRRGNRREDATNANQGTESPRSAAPDQKTEDDKKAERLAKLEAWKKKQAAERERKEKELAAAGGGTRNLLNEMDKKTTESPGTASPQSPGTPQSPVPYAGKFDPKQIAKKAALNAASSAALGGDIAIPTSSTATPASELSNAQAKRSRTAPGIPPPSTATKAVPLKVTGNVGRFGFGKQTQADTAKAPSKLGMQFDEEESTRKKLEKLPTPPLEDGANDAVATSADAAQDDDGDEDDEMEDVGDEEEAAAAARAAAEKREERILAQSQNQRAENPTSGVAEDIRDIAMTDAPTEVPAAEDEEEFDPLDAFMDGLTDSSSMAKAPGISGAKSRSKQDAEELFLDDDDEYSTIDASPDDILEMAKAKRKKDIPTVNHAKMNYEPFKKDFYVEPSELAEMEEGEVADLRLELDGIKVRGVDVPKPVMKWAQCGLGVQSLDVIQNLGYERPTSIQSQAIPAIMSGRDVIGIAKTGSGKTMAFLLPMFRHIKDQRPLATNEGPIAFIMTPTRELATQIHRECKPWLKALNLRAVCAYGGAPIKDQIAELRRGAEIVVCTPGRMIEMLAANGGRVTNLRRVTYCVLDEADRMFDMGFEPQVMKILANIRPQRQTVLFSATFPRNMEALARKTLQKPVEIVVGGRSVVAPEIKQVVEVRPDNSKFLRLLQLLGEIHEDEDARSLIFVDRQESAEELMNAILKKGYPCFTIHGGKDQYDRDSVISDFKAGVFPVLVATSVAARGLDVKQLKMVVNFDCPNHLEDYVHRAGRTGRAGNTGLAVTFVTEEQGRYAIDIAKALRQSGQEVPEALKKLADEFTAKVKDGKEKTFGGGFGGRGLEKLDQDRDSARARERGLYKTGDDDEDEKEKEKKEKDKDVAVEEVQVKAAGMKSAPLVGVPEGIDLDAQVKVHKTEIAPVDPKDRMKSVASAVDAINARLRKTGDIRGNAPIDNKGPDAGAFHATIEINDFPQKARWAVTNRTNVAKILEATGTSITTKGNFYATGTTPGPNDMPKLYILVEGDTEVVVQNACREMMRLLKEGTIAAADSEARAPASGRYSVL